MRPPPGRRNVVVSRDPDYRTDGAEVFCAMADALTDKRTWVIGGSEIYHLALPEADRCEITEGGDRPAPPEDEGCPGARPDESWVGTSTPWHDSSSGLRYRFHTFLRP